MISPEERAEIYDTVQREQPRIEKFVRKSATRLTSLSDVGQKQAVAQLVLTFVLSVYPDDEKGALALSEAMRAQVDMYIRQIFSPPGAN